MSSKEQKTPNEQVSEEMDQQEVLPEMAEGVDLRDARIAELETQPGVFPAFKI